MTQPAVEDGLISFAEEIECLQLGVNELKSLGIHDVWVINHPREHPDVKAKRLDWLANNCGDISVCALPGMKIPAEVIFAAFPDVRVVISICSTASIMERLVTPKAIIYSALSGTISARTKRFDGWLAPLLYA